MFGPETPIHEMYARMVKVIEERGGKVPGINDAGSLTLFSDFCWALDLVPQISLQPIQAS